MRLAALAGTQPTHDIAAALDKTYLATTQRAHVLGISLAFRKRLYTPAEDAQMRAMAGKRTAREMGAILNRTRLSIHARAHDQRIRLAKGAAA